MTRQKRPQCHEILLHKIFTRVILRAKRHFGLDYQGHISLRSFPWIHFPSLLTILKQGVNAVGIVKKSWHWGTGWQTIWYPLLKNRKPDYYISPKSSYLDNVGYIWITDYIRPRDIICLIATWIVNIMITDINVNDWYPNIGPPILYMYSTSWWIATWCQNVVIS